MIIKISNISKSFCDNSGINRNIINNFSVELNFQHNNIISILSSSTLFNKTLLKIISGLVIPDSGNLTVNELTISTAGKKIIFVPAEPISIPWLSVEKNITFEIPGKKLSDEKLKYIIELVGLDGYEKHIPHKNSFGFRFRISLGRALASNPDLILLDESFCKMNSITKEEIFSTIRNIIKNTGVKILFATKNITDAIYLSDEIIFISEIKNESPALFKNIEKFSMRNEIFSSSIFKDIISKIQYSKIEEAEFHL